MMLLLFALGQHDAHSEVQNQLRPEEMLFAFLDDMCVVCRPGRVRSTPSWQMRCGVMSASRCMQARRRSGPGQVSDQKHAISSSGEPTLQWNGRECSEEGWRQRRENAAPRSWGHFSDIQSSWSTICRPCVNTSKLSSTEFLLFPDVQSAWALLLHCATARANYFIRVVPPDNSHPHVVAHDNALWRCLCAVLRVPRKLFSLSVVLAAVPSVRPQRLTGPVGRAPSR